MPRSRDLAPVSWSFPGSHSWKELVACLGYDIDDDGLWSFLACMACSIISWAAANAFLLECPPSALSRLAFLYFVSTHLYGYCALPYKWEAAVQKAWWIPSFHAHQKQLERNQSLYKPQVDPISHSHLCSTVATLCRWMHMMGWSICDLGNDTHPICSQMSLYGIASLGAFLPGTRVPEQFQEMLRCLHASALGYSMISYLLTSLAAIRIGSAQLLLPMNCASSWTWTMMTICLWS